MRDVRRFRNQSPPQFFSCCVRLLRSCFFAAAAASVLTGAAQAQDREPGAHGPGGLTVVVDGKTVVFKDAPPQVVVGRTMVPLRGVFEAIGAYVEWDGEHQTITAKRNNEVVEMRLGDKVAKKNGAEILLDALPKVIRGTTMVPLRFVSEALGAKVSFDKGNNRVLIETPS